MNTGLNIGLWIVQISLLGMAFGPLLSLAFVGFYHFFRLHRNSVMLQASILYAIIAGTIVNVMIVVQSAIFRTIPREARAELGLGNHCHPDWRRIAYLEFGNFPDPTR